MSVTWTSHPGRLAAGAALAVAALPVPGARFYLLLLAVLVVLDGLVPESRPTASSADDRFDRLVAHRRRARLVARLRSGKRDGLWVLRDAGGAAALADQRDLGVQSIDIATITGTVEPEKARIFDGRFRPGATARARWTQVWLAHARGGALPPIAVYRVGDEHVVRDGHHRVSVARDLGLSALDAEVVELHRTRRG